MEALNPNDLFCLSISSPHDINAILRLSTATNAFDVWVFQNFTEEYNRLLFEIRFVSWFPNLCRVVSGHSRPESKFSFWKQHVAGALSRACPLMQSINAIGIENSQNDYCTW
jgi:hypothetical protein